MIKLFIISILNPNLYKRFKRLKNKQTKRLNAVEAVESFLIKWYDIPLYYQIPMISTILNVPKGFEISVEWVMEYNMRTKKRGELIKSLPLKWYE